MTEHCTKCNGKGKIALDQGDELPRRLTDCPHCNSFAAVKAGRMTDMDRFIEAADALATARRVSDDAIKMCEDGYPVSAYNVALQVVRALANEAPE